MRPALITAIALISLALCVGGGLLWHTSWWRMGGLKGPPDLAKNMYPQAGTLSPSWSQRLRQAFPVGSPEKKMTDSLTGQGFEVDLDRRRAAYGWAVYPCVYTLTVDWRADSSRRLRDIQGGLLNACTDPAKLIPERPSRRGPAGVDAPRRKLVPDSQSA